MFVILTITFNLINAPSSFLFALTASLGNPTPFIQTLSPSTNMLPFVSQKVFLSILVHSIKSSQLKPFVFIFDSTTAQKATDSKNQQYL